MKADPRYTKNWPHCDGYRALMAWVKTDKTVGEVATEFDFVPETLLFVLQFHGAFRGNPQDGAVEYPTLCGS